MRQFLIMVGAIVALCIVFFSLILVGNLIAQKLGPSGRWYDCSIAEISPDYPVEVKEQCRKLRSQK